MVLYHLFSQLFDFHIDGVIQVSMFMCVLICLCFILTRGQSSSILMGNKLDASILGVNTIDMKITLGKTIHLKNMQHVPTINMNLISVCLLC
jgi:hypothetical protein